MQRREPNEESKPTAAIDRHDFHNADPRDAGRLDDKQGGDTIVTMERVREAITFNAAHIRANGLSLETDRWGRARGESRGFRQQPMGT